jgi:hypothetical protein
MDNIVPLYQYQSLEAQEIRLLVLLPGSSFDDIRCELKNVLLSDKPNYEALSYAWGDSAKTKSVLCDEKHILITESLFVALEHLAYEDEPRCMWADGICINQESHTEKNHQVALMGQIYSQAEKTIVWIGEDEINEAGYAFDILKSCGLVGLLNEGLDKIHTVMRSVTNDMGASSEITNIDQAIEAFIVGVSPIFKKNWFNRLWVAQEVVLAERADMVFSFHSIQLDIAYSVIGNLLIKLYRTHQPISMASIRSVENFIETGNMRDNIQTDDPYRQPPQTEVLYFLRKMQNRKCSDQRDKIYGLLGMASVPGFHADYTLDVDEVYMQFATWALKSLPGFVIFSCAREVGNDLSNLPTSAPGPNMPTLVCPLT